MKSSEVYRTVGPMRFIVISALALVALLNFGCLEEIDLPAPPGTDEAIVIQGSIVKGDPSVIFVTVRQLFTFTSSTVKPINAKLVEVIDESGNSIEVDEQGLGAYRLEIPVNDPSFSIEFGKSYQLHVETRDGREYFTNLEPLVEVPAQDSIVLSVVDAEVIDEDGQIEIKKKMRISVYTDSALPGSDERARLKWDVERTYKVTDSPPFPSDSSKVCYLTENLAGPNLQVVDGNDRVESYIDGQIVYDASITSAYGEGAYITVYQQSISPGAYEYWRQALLLIDRSGNMFEPPAGQIATNFTNPNDPKDDAFGYFYCYAQDTMRLYIAPEDVLSPAPSCPPPGGVLNENGDCVSRTCCNCLDHPDSTLEKPEFWTE